MLAATTQTSDATFKVTAGDLSLDSVQTFNFGEDALDASFKYDPSINLSDGIKVSDYRGSLAGWKLQLKFSNFEDTTDNAKTLTGATLSLTTSNNITNDNGDNLTAPTSVPSLAADANHTVLTVKTGTGAGQTSTSYSKATLNLPKKVKAGDYKSNVTWTLSDTPANN